MVRINQSGFKRNDTTPVKERYDLIPTWVLQRLATLYAEGASRFGERNWELANAKEDLVSFHASMMRHMIQYVNDAEDEDHFARSLFNIIGMEHVKIQLKNKK